MADKYHHEAYRTLNAYGFYADHHPDGQVKKFADGRWTHAQIETGRADIIFVGQGIGGAIEVKTAQEGRYFRYGDEKSGWKPAQREWSAIWERDYGNTYWLWITFGERANAKVRPRLTLLLPKTDWLVIESILIKQGKKSMSYDMAESYTDYRLKWAGNSSWIIPETHAFWKQFCSERIVA